MPNTLADKLRFDAPIPGQSLTTNPDTPMPYESPPEFVHLEEAQAWMFEKITESENTTFLLDAINSGFTIEDLAITLAFNGFAEGKWNPDLVLLLLEPIMYMLLFICEQAGQDYILSEDEDAELSEPYDDILYKRSIDKLSKQTSEKVAKASSSADIPSLLAKTGGMQ